MSARPSLSQRIADRAASRLSDHGVTRRGFLYSTAIVGSALAVAPRRFLLQPISALDAITGCGPDSSCSSGYTVFCCTINNGVNQCPPGTFPGGWWKASNSSFCCGAARYIIDCQAECTRCGCNGSSFCPPGCVNCTAHCQPGPTCDQRLVCNNVFRYGQCNQQVGCSGPVACRVTTCTPPWQIPALACTSAAATDDETAEHGAPCLAGCAPPPPPVHQWGPGNLLTNGSFEGSFNGWFEIAGFQASTYHDTANAHDGQWVANAYTTQAQGSLYQDVPVNGQSFVGSIWVRSSDGTPLTGELALFGLGSSDSNVTYFTATAQWTQVQVPLDIHSNTVTGVRYQLYLGTVGHNLDFDGAELTANLLTNGSFEGSFNGWFEIAGFQASTYHDAANAHDGQWVANAYTTQALGSLYQDVPISGLSPGQSLVGSIWVRSSDGTPLTGELALFGLGSSDSNVTYFTATAQWTQVQVPLDIHSNTVTGVRYQLYLGTVGHNLDFDGAELTGRP